MPSYAVPNTPIFLLATAGVRLLPDHQRTLLLKQICSYIRSSTKFLLPDCQLHVQAISGETEGLYGWVAANYLLGSFDAPSVHDHGKGHHTYGFLDMGGASAQIAFAPNATEAEKHANDLKLLRLRTIDGASSEYRVFVTTWLGFGVHEARKRYVHDLLEASATHDTRELPDPCLPVGLLATQQGDVVPSGARDSHGQGPALIGTGRFDECLRKTYPLLDMDAPCQDQPCLLHGVHVPAIDFDVNHFVGVSEYWHTTHEVFEMAHTDKSYDFHTYQKRVKEFCSQDWKTISDKVQSKGWGHKVDERTAIDVCFKAAWLINVLHDGIGVPREALEHTSTAHNGTKEVLQHAKEKGYLDPFQAVNKIQDVEVSWTLGKMVLYAASQIPSSSGGLPVGFGSNTAGVPADFQYAGTRETLSSNTTIGHDMDDVPDWQETLLDSDSHRRIPGFILFFFVIGVVVFLWCGRHRRTRLFRRFFRSRGRPGSPKKRKGLGGALFGGSAANGYDRVLEEGDPRAEFELTGVDSDLDESDSSDGNRVARSSGWATPQLKLDPSPSTSYFDHPPSVHGVGLGLGLGPTPHLVGNAMDRSGLVVRTDSRDRLAPSITGSLGTSHYSGRRTRNDSPVRPKSPLMTPIPDDYD